jgi:hypothetical protein
LAWRCEVAVSPEQSMSIALPDDFEWRPMTASVPRRGTTVGAPPVGQMPAACWAAKKSGSIQISATQSACASDAGAGAGGEDADGGRSNEPAAGGS